MELNGSRYLRSPSRLDDKSKQWRRVREKPPIQGTVVRMLRVREGLRQTQNVRRKARLAEMDGAYHLIRVEFET